ncbi:MAG TPA: hypothetical protein VLM91_28860, partial [Candidatus Methylomirabilis sp.]|nr:hypothetical protein [Candidatus Methylomirabilis sp.]
PLEPTEALKELIGDWIVFHGLQLWFPRDTPRQPERYRSVGPQHQKHEAHETRCTPRVSSSWCRR